MLFKGSRSTWPLEPLLSATPVYECTCLCVCVVCVGMLFSATLEFGHALASRCQALAQIRIVSGAWFSSHVRQLAIAAHA
jgi:hypothetical protein